MDQRRRGGRRGGTAGCGGVSLGWILSVVVILAGCGPEDPEGPAEPLTHDEESIRDARGNPLFHLDDLPADVAVSDGASFGTSGTISGVAGAAGTGRIAFTTVGTAHGYGWLLEVDGENGPDLAVFQYGGQVELVGWDESGRFVAFRVETPAGSSELRIADAQAEGAYPDDRMSWVGLPEAEGLPPEERVYRDAQWEAATLCFTFGGKRHCVSPEAPEAR